MTLDGWITVGVIACMVIVMALNLAGPDLVLVGALAALLATGIIGPDEAFIGFSNPAVITIAALFVVAAGIRETGGLDFVGRSILGTPRNLPGGQMRLMFPVALMSAFLNNTPVVAMFVPLVQDWGRRCKLSVSMLLMPLSYAAILGGSMTLIGTSTNLVVTGMAMAHDSTLRFDIFDITPLGVPVATIGIFYVVIASRWLLKDRKGIAVTPAESREYTVAMRVEKGSPVAGKTIEEAGLRNLENVYLYEVERGPWSKPAVSPHTVLEEDDTLHFTGVTEAMVDLRKMRISPATEQVGKLDGSSERRWVEAVVSNHSSLVGLTIRESRFRTFYNAAILAVHRQGQRVPSKVGDIRLMPADVLLIEARPNWVREYGRDANFALVAEVENSEPPNHDKAPLAMTILVAMVIANVTGFMDLMTAALLSGGLMLITRCITGEQARKALEMRVLIAVASAFGLGLALENSGAAAVIGTRIVEAAHIFGDTGLLVAIYATTAILAGFVSTTASAALMFPIAAVAAETQGIHLKPIALLVMIAASTAFSTPIGYQTNLMVYSAGGYKYSDFLRLGLPLQLLIGTLTVTLLTLFWL